MVSSPGGFRVQPRERSMFVLSGELDMATRPVLDEAIHDVAAAGGPVLLDVSALEFADVAGVHAITDAVEAMPSGCIVLHGVHGEVRTILRALGIEQTPTLHIAACTRLSDPTMLQQPALRVSVDAGGDADGDDG
jgi:anti-anti-sigma factor